MNFRDRIRLSLANEGVGTMRQVSIRAGSDSLLHKVLNPDMKGGIKSPTLDKMEAIAKALGVDPAWLAFGDQRERITESVLREMVDDAVSVIQPDMSIAQMRSAVSAVLNEQLRLYLTVGGFQDTSGEESAPGTIDQSPAPTRRGGKAKSRIA